MLIFNTKGKVSTINNKKNLIHRFDVPQNIKALKISYSYSPKTLENSEKAVEIIKECFDKYDEELRCRPADLLPVNNLITISVDCNGKYIGCAHRQANQQEHIISPEKSSNGFVKTTIEAGEWDIMLNVHYVACDVDYTISVEGVEE
jgi:hypothetical protein